MNQFFKILLSFLSFFIFGAAEGLAFVEIGENKSENLEEDQLASISTSNSNVRTKDFLHHLNGKTSLDEQNFSNSSIENCYVQFSFNPVSKSIFTPVVQDSQGNEGKLYLLFHRLLYYI
ncbi:hypothetical protein SAMN05660776_2539 [Salegentibacter holothuriorum]|uniref:Uncharacterized protein n=1 Tax=Salegentibacter holothuriorum TaxID=241145 RepID=A0A1T5D8Y8_9FLAO|nr:hypothetical protein [Salegentibacter holothuriorum]SKB68238.1 hypothetical protein SAMN05660776_2539 [Salegentibacter holothuriorum]